MADKKRTRDGSLISKQILEEARRSVSADSAVSARVRKCVVCGDDVAPNSTEELCWVCRRLKISAWRDSDQQMPAQE